jgi:hypothetical protein
MNVQSTCLSADTVARYLQGRMPDSEAALLEGHVHECVACFNTLA